VFDGHEFKNYTAADGLPRGSIRQITEIHANNSSTMWAMTQKGSVSRLRDGYFETFPYDSTTRWGHTIRWLAQDHLGTIWAAMEDTLAQIAADTLRPVVSGIRMRSLVGIFEQGDSLLWFVAQSGLVYYSFESKQFNRLSLGRFDEMSIVDCFLDGEGGLWVGLGGYLIYVLGKKVVNERQTPAFDFVVDDRQGSLWFGTYSGLYRLSKDRFSTDHIDHFTVDNGLMENTLKCAFVDRESNLWVGGISKGLAKLSEKSIYRFPLEGILPIYHYSIGAADSNNHIWVVSSDGLWEIWEYPAGRWHKVLAWVEEGQGPSQAYPVFYIKNVLVKKTLPYSIFIDHLGRLWIEYSNAQLACYRVTPGKDAPSRLHLVRAFRPGLDYPNIFPLCFIVDKNERVWYSKGNGIALLDTKRKHPLLRLFGERENWPIRTYVKALFADNRGSIWAGFFNKGVEVLDADSIVNGAFHQLSIPQLAANERIASIKQDHDGNVWIASETSGLTILQKGIIGMRTIKDGLPSNIVTSMTEDMNGRFWVSTNLGVVYFDSISSTLIHRKGELIGSFVFCSGTTRNGLLWFVTSDGLVTYNPMNEVRNRIPPPAMITRVQVNGNAMAFTNGMELSHEQNNFGIGFIAISFRDDQEIQYQYRMRGIEEDWQPNTRATSVMYAALPPGKYTFEVKAVGDRGVSGAGQALAFSIVPPFWKAWWFTTLFWLTIAGSTVGTIRYVEITKLRRQLRALEQQQALERERLRISSDLHDELASNLSSIAMLSKIAESSSSVRSDDLLQKNQLLSRITSLSQESVDSIRDIIWAIDPKGETLESLLTRLRDMIIVSCRAKNIRWHFEQSSVKPLPPTDIPPEIRSHLWLLLKEAVNNALKHSACSTLSLCTEYVDGMLKVIVKDNGSGFDLSEATGGKGLRTMRMRAEQMGGKLEHTSKPGEGTVVELKAKM
jgi:signal transduction histidine kinase/streptogramin lyase